MFRYVSLFCLQLVLLLVSLLMIWLRYTFVARSSQVQATSFNVFVWVSFNSTRKWASDHNFGIFSFRSKYQISLVIIFVLNGRIENLAVHHQNICWLTIFLILLFMSVTKCFFIFFFRLNIKLEKIVKILVRHQLGAVETQKVANKTLVPIIKTS